MKRFNEQVKRNINRFPSDFMFRLNIEEFAVLRSQFVTSKREDIRSKSQFAILNVRG
ncbi:MAG: ORF6N domain-containing protein [Candidatus Aureabacteria bacterium]|nr:ORF6N domain-containing protein [Candidatus Auribacterota bacterium]